MSPKDTRHYKFLKDAVVNKYKIPQAPSFQAIPYDPYIFRWASNTFYELKLFDYLDIRERGVLVRLYENLKRDPRLKFLDDPDSLKDKIEFKLPESFHQRIEAEKTKLQVVSGQAAPAGGPVGQSTRPMTQKTPRINIRPPGVSFGSGNVLRNLGSQSSIFLKKNVFGKILTPTRLVTGFTTILGGIAGSGLGPIGTLAGAGAGFLAPSYVKTFGARHLTNFARWGADSMVRLSAQTSRLSMSGFGGKSVLGKRVAIAAILLFFGVGALAAFAPLPGQQTPPVGASPIGAGCPALTVIAANKNPTSCRYLNPSIDLFDINISQGAINSYVEKYSPIFIKANAGDKDEFIRRTNYIVDNAKQAQLNPALFLGYWKSESNFSTLGTRHMGCLGDTFEEQVDCALAIKAFSDPAKNPVANCARSKDAGSVACTTLKGLRTSNGYDTTHPIQYPVSTVDNFAESYGPYDHLLNGQPTNCTHTYNTLIEVAQELNACKVAPIAGGIVPIGQGGDKIASVARQIAAQLIHSTSKEDAEKRVELATLGIPCEPGGAAGPSYHCWLQSPKYNQIPKDEGYVQCTEFVWAVFEEAGYKTQIDKIRQNDAYNWPDAALNYPDTFTVFSDPLQLAPGDIISLGLGSGGIAQHVAVVIEKDQNTVKVAQASTAQPTETYNIESGKLKIINPTNARCTPETNPGCRVTFIHLKPI